MSWIDRLFNTPFPDEIDHRFKMAKAKLELLAHPAPLRNTLIRQAAELRRLADDDASVIACFLIRSDYLYALRMEAAQNPITDIFQYGMILFGVRIEVCDAEHVPYGDLVAVRKTRRCAESGLHDRRDQP